MYTIKQAATMAGVTTQVLRAWERRYDVVEPGRTAAGYRLYDDAAISRLRAMRGLIDAGWTAGNAAAHIRALDDVAVRELVGVGSLAEHSAEQGQPEAMARPERLTAAFVDSAAAFDERATERVLDDMFSRGSFEQVTRELVMPALVALGDGWAKGRLDVAAEHAATAAVQRRLAMAFFAAGFHADGPVVLIGLPPGSQHDLGALAFATSARRAGVSARYLGSDIPVADWLEAVELTNARAVVIGVVMKRDAKAAVQLARAIQQARPEVLIALGGRGAAATDTAELGPVLLLPQEIDQAIEVLRAQLAG